MKILKYEENVLSFALRSKKTLGCVSYALSPLHYVFFSHMRRPLP